jgi:nucleotide-binding universal stress UspA family protein
MRGFALGWSRFDSLDGEDRFAMLKARYRVLVPVDGTSVTRDVLDRAADVALAERGEVTLLHVRGRPAVRIVASTTPMGVELPKQTDGECDTILMQAASYMRNRGVPARTERRDGRVRRGIVQAAGDSDIDIIVMGCHGHAGLGKLLHGCISEYVRHHVSCPVTTVP